MKKIKKVLAAMLVLSMVLLSACKNAKKESDVAGKVYTYTGASFSKLESDRFTITINADGTFSYYESMLSSYIGMGTWTLEGEVLTLSDDEEMGYPFVNHFRIDGEDLYFIEEGSSNFIYVKVKDGERFSGKAVVSDGE